MRGAFDAALAAIDARRATAEALRVRPIQGPVHVLALGKAAIGMAEGAREACDVRTGLVIAPRGVPEPAWPSGWTLLRGRHPVPDPDVASRGDALLARAAAIPESDTALVLISGGGSALVDAPVPGVTVWTLASLTQRLMRSGANIEELNAIRVALSRSKGGGLARALRTRSVRVLVISDIVGDDGTRVASGPMSEWRSPSPREVAARPHIAAALGEAAQWVEGAVAMPTPEHPIEVVADNARAVQAAVASLEAAGLRVGTGPTLSAEARRVGAAWSSVSADASVDALVAGGESIVLVRGQGFGGRNQEVALAALVAGIRGTFLCAGTDGIDGPTHAAGAIVDDAVRAKADLAAAQRALDDNDSTTFFERYGGLLVTGPTGTNVADLAIWTR